MYSAQEALVTRTVLVTGGTSGLGRAMMDTAERWLAARGIWKVQLLIREDNAAVKQFYEHLGYRDTRTSCYQKIIGTAQS